MLGSLTYRAVKACDEPTFHNEYVGGVIIANTHAFGEMAADGISW
jgi:hypothetical protein